MQHSRPRKIFLFISKASIKSLFGQANQQQIFFIER